VSSTSIPARAAQSSGAVNATYPRITSPELGWTMMARPASSRAKRWPVPVVAAISG
jgi:hypothetical protein